MDLSPVWIKSKPGLILDLFEPEFEINNYKSYYLNSKLVKDVSIFKAGETISYISLDKFVDYYKLQLISDKISTKMFLLNFQNPMHNYFNNFRYYYQNIKYLGLDPDIFIKILIFRKMYHHIVDDQVFSGNLIEAYILLLENQRKQILEKLEKKPFDLIPPFCWIELENSEAELELIKSLKTGFWENLPKTYFKKLNYVKNFMKRISKITKLKFSMEILGLKTFEMLTILRELRIILGIEVNIFNN